ncbi:MAG: hypothetical protein AAGA03_04910 [Planctomycetota bacterium]
MSRTTSPASSQTPSAPTERMWPLDLALVALTGLVLYLVFTQLRFDDPRPLYNSYTYAVAVPVISLLLALLLRGIASQYFQKSVQLGFITSVTVHLLLLILAVQWVIFPNYFKDAYTSKTSERSPVQKTVPEYLFRTPKETSTTPDWAKPVDAETASRVVPQQERLLPPLQQSAPLLEMPQPKRRIQPDRSLTLMRRPEQSQTQPKPSDAPSKLARREQVRPTESISQSLPQAPRLPQPNEPSESQEPTERSEAVSRPRSRASSQAPPAPREMAPFSAPDPIPQPTVAALTPRDLAPTPMPTIGDSGVQRQRSSRSSIRRASPAGSAPVAPSVAIAREDQRAERMLLPAELPARRQSDVAGAQIAGNQTQTAATGDLTETSVASLDLNAQRLASMEGMPNIDRQPTLGRASQGRYRPARTGIGPVGLPDPSELADAANQLAGKSPDASDATRDDPGDRLDSTRPQRRSRDVSTNLAAESMDPLLDLMLPSGRPGLADRPSPTTGLIPSMDQPEIPSMELSESARPRRSVGGPTNPVGAKIAAVESFNRRVMRTQGGAAPAPAGMVGPQTEEAIELGLAYLAQRQNPDGSWSLQGDEEEEEVLLASDTAATGLCLLAFQGAGYTHKRHQYAGTIARGLDFLRRGQKTNGDLFRPEDPTSNQNVALYSQGIAALAVCEAYGMTQDPDLQEMAQRSLDYIAGTQHRRRGGWRYTPQISADTSVSGWMMMALKSGELAGLEVQPETYAGIERWLDLAQESPERADRYRYNPFAPDTASQRHGRRPTQTMTAVGMLMRMYTGWRRDRPAMKSAAEYLLKYPPQVGTIAAPQRDTYYWYYATQVMFHMGGDYWQRWNQSLNPILLESQVKVGDQAGSWHPDFPVPDRWSPYAGRLYVTTMNLLNLEVFYRHLPIYEETAE